MESAQKVLQKTKQLTDKINKYKGLYTQWEDLVTLVSLGNEMEDLSVLDEVKEGYEDLTKSLEDMRLETLLSEPYDKNNAIMTIHPGAGGTEAQDWAEMLLRMYTRWAERRGFKVEILSLFQWICEYRS